MQHALFGTLRRGGRAWVGSRRFPRLVAFGVRAPAREEEFDEEAQRKLLADARAGLDRMRDKLREKLGPDADQLLAALDGAAAAPPAGPDPEDEEEFGPSLGLRAEADREEERSKEEARLREQGLFPFRVGDPEGEGPPPEQEAAFRHLVEHEATVCNAVLRALFASYRQYSEDERWRKICGLPEIGGPEGLTAAAHLLRFEVTRGHEGGASRLLFEVDCDWEQEHGMYVVYHRDWGAEWTTGDGVFDLLGFEDAGEDAADASGNQELFEAVIRGDQARAEQLRAEGHDINDLGEPPSYPPLCLAVHQMDVGLVRRLLAVGADLNLKDSDKKTPLRHARSMLKALTSGKGDKLMEAMFAIARKAHGEMFEGSRAKLEEIVRLLEAAGGT